MLFSVGNVFGSRWLKEILRDRRRKTSRAVLRQSTSQRPLPSEQPAFSAFVSTTLWPLESLTDRSSSAVRS